MRAKSTLDIGHNLKYFLFSVKNVQATTPIK